MGCLLIDVGHCEGAKSTLATEAKATTEAEHDHDHDEHDHDHTGSESLAPSPTESTGCEPHGDHWHCDAAKTGAEAKATDDHDHSHASGATESLSPSPTESVGCEPHGDHCKLLSPLSSRTLLTPPRALRRSCYRSCHSYRERLCCCYRQWCRRPDHSFRRNGRRCCSGSVRGVLKMECLGWSFVSTPGLQRRIERRDRCVYFSKDRS